MEARTKEMIYLIIIAIMGICFFAAVYNDARVISEYQKLYFDCINPYISSGINTTITLSGGLI